MGGVVGPCNQNHNSCSELQKREKSCHWSGWKMANFTCQPPSVRRGIYPLCAAAIEDVLFYSSRQCRWPAAMPLQASSAIPALSCMPSLPIHRVSKWPAFSKPALLKGHANSFVASYFYVAGISSHVPLSWCLSTSCPMWGPEIALPPGELNASELSQGEWLSSKWEAVATGNPSYTAPVVPCCSTQSAPPQDCSPLCARKRSTDAMPLD